MAHEISPRFNIAEWFLDRPADAHPERIAILGKPRAVCYGELRELANGGGDGPGAGGGKICAVQVPVNSFARAGDYSFYISDSGASIAIVDESALDEFSSAVAAAASKVRVIVAGESSGDGGVPLAV